MNKVLKMLSNAKIIKLIGSKFAMRSPKMKLEILKMPKMLTLHINANNYLIYKMLSNAQKAQNAFKCS